MPEIEEQQYGAQRWEDQCRYYSSASRRNKRWHQVLLVVKMLCAIAAPVVLNLEFPFAKIVATGLSCAVAAAAALENIFHFGDSWRSYRMTLEMLRRERWLYETASGPYRV